MIRLMAVVACLLSSLVTLQVHAQRPTPQQVAVEFQRIQRRLPPLSELMAALSEEPPPPASAASLPQPSLTDAFEIGGALHDPGRLADAVVSMLALMGIGIVPDAAAAAPSAGPRLLLSQSEVRALIDMGTEDLESAGDSENLPYSFADLHRAIAPLVPGLSLEQMAEKYTQAYEQSPDDLIAKAMLGQPLEPETRLTRTQIWLLLMDGFAGATAGGAAWGTADRQMEDARSPDTQWSAAEWREVLARLPLITANRLVTTSAPDVVTQGTTAPAAPVSLTMGANAGAPPLVSRLTGRTLIAARPGSLAGQEVTWRVRDQSRLKELGTITSPTGEPVTVGTDGLARFVLQPGVGSTNGTGELVDAWEPVEARFQTRSLVASAYAVPAPLAGLSIGTSRAQANLRLRWKSPDVLFLMVINRYDGINFQIPHVGGGTRSGYDMVLAKLVRTRAGDYEGAGSGRVEVRQELRGPTTCRAAEIVLTQRLLVKLAKGSEPGFGPAKSPADILWQNPGDTRRDMKTDPPDGGYYRLVIIPAEEPNLSRPEQRQCLPLIPASPERQTLNARWLIPFNDAQWTTEGTGYGIALQSKGTTRYVDLSTNHPLDWDPDLEKIKAAFQLTGSTLWWVRAGRTLEDVVR